MKGRCEMSSEQTLRELLAKHEYMNGSCLCREFRLPLYGKKELDEWDTVRGDWMQDIRWKYWLEHVIAALAQPPAPAAAPQVSIGWSWTLEQWKANAIYWNKACVEAWEYRDRAWEKIELLEKEAAIASEAPKPQEVK